MPSYLTPGLYIEKVQTEPGLLALRTDIAAFLGMAERGPVQTPVRLTSQEQFQNRFGGFLPGAYLAYAVKAFFENGGRICYVVRIAAPPVQAVTRALPTDRSGSRVDSAAGFAPGAVVTVTQSPATQTTGAVQPADRSGLLVADVTGFPPGSLVQITQGALASYRLVHAVDAASGLLLWDAALDAAYDLTLPIALSAAQQADHLLQDVDYGLNRLIWADPLEPFFVLSQQIRFDSGAAPAAGTLWGADNRPTVQVAAGSPGIWGNALSVRVTRTSPTAAQTRIDVPQPADRTASLVTVVTGFPAASLVRVVQGALETYRQVTSADPVRKRLAWDLPLDPGYDLTRPISLETVEFTLSVAQGGQVSEIFSGLSLDPTHLRYLEIAINGVSLLIQVTDLRSGSPLPDRLPDPNARNLTRGELSLRSGRDGTAALRELDFTGDPASDLKTGVRTLEDIDEVAIVALPDALVRPLPAVETAPSPPPAPQPCLPCPAAPPPAPPLPPVLRESVPGFTIDQVYAIQQALIAHCELLRYRIAILDPPVLTSSAQVLDLGEIQAWRQRFESRYAALYYPWVQVYDPLLRRQTIRAIPPSGHVAGIYAATDLNAGVYVAPANRELNWAQGLTLEISAGNQALLNPLGINCLRPFPGRGLRVYGARTVSSEADWRFVNVRRLMMLIEKTAELSSQWAVFEPNDYRLRQTLTHSLSVFLNALWERGALVGATADQAFFVQCDAQNNPPALTEIGQLIVQVGVAPTRPAEFVVFRIGRTEDTLTVHETEAPTQ